MATVESGVWGGAAQGGFRFGTSSGPEARTEGPIFDEFLLTFNSSQVFDSFKSFDFNSGCEMVLSPIPMLHAAFMLTEFSHHMPYICLACEALVPTSTMMDFYVGGGIDVAFLGVGEARSIELSLR